MNQHRTPRPPADQRIAQTIGDMQAKINRLEKVNTLLVDCAKELVEIIDGSPSSIDSFTTQPMRAALAEAEKKP